jgi:hypothetical protein
MKDENQSATDLKMKNPHQLEMTHLNYLNLVISQQKKQPDHQPITTNSSTSNNTIVQLKELFNCNKHNKKKINSVSTN